MKTYQIFLSIYVLILMLFAVISTPAQTTAFNFQGRLNDGSSPANGKYDLQFKIYDALTGGNQVGATLARSNLTLINGVFSTQLDFGSTVFDGSNRFIEVGLRQTAAGSTTPNAYVILGPRQQILSVPYSIRSLRSTLADNATHADNAANADLAINSNKLGGYSSDRYLRYSDNDNVGIGTDLPVDKLTIKTATNSYGLVQTDGSVQVGTAVGIAGSGELVGSFGTKTNHTLRLFTNNNGSGGMTLDVNSNIRQPLTSNGLVKAMAEVDIDGNILQCYNSNLIGNAATATPCGIGITHFTAGGYGINFNFRVDNRFVSITPTIGQYFGPIRSNGGAYYVKTGAGTNTINVRTYLTGEVETTKDIGFMIFIF